MPAEEHPERVTVGDLERPELELIAWSGSPSHIKNVAGQLDRRDRGVVDYLVVRDAEGLPIAKGAVDYEEAPSAGTIMQFATRADLEGRGHATRLMEEAERRIRERGLPTARLAVELINQRARRLYEYLGYRSLGERETGWEHEREDGAADWYSTVVVDMQKQL